MYNFWDSSTWGLMLTVAALLGSLLIGNMLKKEIPLLRNSLIPTSVIGGTLLIIIAAIYKAITGDIMFDAAAFNGNGTVYLEMITYHTLALGFIASSLKTTGGRLSKERTVEIFNTGVTTVASYVIQGIFGLAITMIAAALFMPGFFEAAGIILPFGYGQGTGQAMNYGNIYETQYGFVQGKSFGLIIAALGFFSASFGGVIHLNVMKRTGRLKISGDKDALNREVIEDKDEIPMQESVDKMSIQLAFVFASYGIAYILMYLLSMAFPGMKSTIFGFNFLIGVLCATLVKLVMNVLKKRSVLKKQYTNNFLLTRAENFFFDVMIISGLAAIRLDVLEKYWGIAIILGVVGLVITYAYNRIVAKLLFKNYTEEQFLMMYGMLTGTASTGIILLREIDGDFKTPAADNLVYQNFPAIALGFPMLLLATIAPENPLLTFGILIAYFIVLNVILFRKFIFKRGRASSKCDSAGDLGKEE